VVAANIGCTHGLITATAPRVAALIDVAFADTLGPQGQRVSDESIGTITDLSVNALRLAKFFAIALVVELKRRAELDEHSSGSTGLELARRIEADPSTAAGLESDDPVDERNATVQLTDKTVSAALTSGCWAFFMVSLALRSGLEEPVVHSFLNSRGGKAITALAWKADLDMAFALQNCNCGSGICLRSAPSARTPRERFR
jgi:hypothetical protein